MKTNIYLLAGLLLIAISFISCDNTEKEPSGTPATIELECVAQFENSLLGYVDVEATWTDATGTERHAYPAPHYLEHGNRQYSRITVNTEHQRLPVSTEVTLTYKAKDGVVDAYGFVDIPKEGIDVIVYTGVNVTKSYESDKAFRTTFDITSYIRQNVSQEEFLDVLAYLNTNCNRIYFSADADGKLTTNATTEEAPDETESDE